MIKCLVMRDISCRSSHLPGIEIAIGENTTEASKSFS